MKSGVAIPAAIVIGCGLIAIAVYLGLRSPAPSTPAITSASTMPPRRPVPTATVQIPPEVMTKLVEAELAKHRDELVTTCWKPAAKKEPAPDHTKLTFDFTFSADGSQLGRSVREDRETGRPDVTACVLGELPPLKLRGLGIARKSTVTFVLP